jgi:hypothetical protein
MNNQSEIGERSNALVIYKFLVTYNKFEDLIKQIFASKFDELDSEVKNRISYYVGWLGSEVKYIDYDTYSIKQEIQKFDKKNIISKLTINQIIKIDKKDKIINNFSFEISSMTKKHVSYLSHDCFLSLIRMRNKLAHDILKINFKNADIIEQLPISIISNTQDDWFKNIGTEGISNDSICILSNSIYMMKIIDKLEQEVQ